MPPYQCASCATESARGLAQRLHRSRRYSAPEPSAHTHPPLALASAGRGDARRSGTNLTWPLQPWPLEPAARLAARRRADGRLGCFGSARQLGFAAAWATDRLSRGRWNEQVRGSSSPPLALRSGRQPLHFVTGDAHGHGRSGSFFDSLPQRTNTSGVALTKGFVVASRGPSRVRVAFLDAVARSLIFTPLFCLAAVAFIVRDVVVCYLRSSRWRA